MINRILLALVDEFVVTPRGVKIPNPGQSIMVTNNSRFTRKSFKYFVESRLAQGVSKAEIIYLVKRAPDVINNPDLNIKNPKGKYISSRLLGSYFVDTQKAVMVVLDGGDEIKDIISLHFKSKKSFDSLFELYK